jgi:hypothetical protein
VIGVALPLSAPVGILLLTLLAVYFIAVGWRWVARKRRAVASLKWPLADATIEKSTIERNEFLDGGASWTLELNFSYRPPPGLHGYAGVYTEELGSRADAEAQLLSLRERQLYARYNPTEPGESFMDPYRDVFRDERGSSQRILKY